MTNPKIGNDIGERDMDWRMALRRIAGFHQDEAGDWVADLECGHTQHVRHNPPWQVREWVLTADGRRGNLGRELNCPACDKGSVEVAEGRS